ncbi:hypothetical protein C8J57DRAFT_1181710 [Mycena rebaudengoi]|nr:hypothetical protein C8J57DRAFT_1181710 [Mycena rebaudengoi]
MMRGYLRNQDRLYLALSHRYSQPGYHWALILAPKDIPGSKSPESDSKCWDISNLNSAHEWNFRDAMMSQYTAPSLIARVLLAKFSSRDREANILSINSILQELDIRQGDATFTYRFWALNGVDALREHGLIDILPQRETIEEQAKELGDMAVTLLSHGELDIAAHGACIIPVLDLRRSSRPTSCFPCLRCVYIWFSSELIDTWSL